MVRVKICGITNLEDALVGVAAGADALGFNFWPHSRRYIPPGRAAEIIAHLPPLVTPVGVFVNEKPMRVRSLAARAGLHTVQLHGDETPEEAATLAATPLTVFKAVRVGRRFQPRHLSRYARVAAFLLDADVRGQRGGTGKAFDWKRARAAARYGRIVLAGGLTVENVAHAVATAQPYGVDACTGVEKKPGVKDHARLREFIRRVKAAPTV